MLNRPRWRYETGVVHSAVDLADFQDKLTKNDFYFPFFEKFDECVVRLCFLINTDKEVKTNSKFGVVTNLRIDRYLAEDNSKSCKLFASFMSDNLHAYEFFKEFFIDSWINVSHSCQSIGGIYVTYVETNQLSLSKKEEMEFFIEKINNYYHLPKDLNHTFRIAAGLHPVPSLYSLSIFAVSKLKQQVKICDFSEENILKEVKMGFINNK